ncbi:MAG: acylphosphatase [Lentisphaeria bacterium]|nr:acylphosphatase [Lentisphaeria bacterium]
MSNTSVTFELRGDLMKPGFKTLIWELAVNAGLGGWVTESQDGTYILLRLDGDEDAIRKFIRPIPGKLLPAYPLKNICVSDQSSFEDTALIRDFKVFQSGDYLLPELVPDKTFCPDCLAEIMDPASPRYAYPFSFCAKCGPQYSMLMRAPGVRKNTTYAAFPA